MRYSTGATRALAGKDTHARGAVQKFDKRPSTCVWPHPSRCPSCCGVEKQLQRGIVDSVCAYQVVVVDLPESNVVVPLAVAGDGPTSRSSLLSRQDMTFIEAAEMLLSSHHTEAEGWQRDDEMCEPI